PGLGTLECGINEIVNDDGIKEIRWQLEGQTLYGNNVIFEQILNTSVSVHLRVEDNHQGVFEGSQNYSVPLPGIKAGIVCNKEGGNYVFCYIEEQPINIKIASAKWFENDVLISENEFFSKYYEAVGRYTIKS